MAIENSIAGAILPNYALIDDKPAAIENLKKAIEKKAIRNFLSANGPWSKKTKQVSNKV